MRRLNKRGQEGFSTTGLLAIIFGVAVLIVVLLFVFKGKSLGEDVFNLANEKATSALQVCAGTVKAVTDEGIYCGNFIKIETKNIIFYDNCWDLAKKATPNPQWTDDISCKDNKDKRAWAKCFDLNQTGELKRDSLVKISNSNCIYEKNAADIYVLHFGSSNLEISEREMNN